MDLEKDVSYYESIEKYEIVKKIIEQAGGNADNIYVTNASFENIFYVEQENGVYISISPLSAEYLDLMDFVTRLPAIRDEQKRLLQEKNYDMFYFYMPKAMQVFDFEHRYKQIETEKVADVLMQIYSRLDFGFSQLNPDVISYVASYAPKIDSKKKITIYRGEGTNSTPLEKAYSWTTDFNVALWFAVKGCGKQLWRAQVEERDIMFRPAFRKGEHEVIVAPDKIQNLASFDMYSGEITAVVRMMQYLSNYSEDYAPYISEVYDRSNNDAHTSSHSIRVLLLSLMIANELELDDEELDILAVASVYHDCKRNDDFSSDVGHGKRAADFMLKEYAYAFDDHILKAASLIVAYHDIDDEIAIPILENSAENNDYSMTLLYKVFKDADALDRVRLGLFRREFDFNMLRLEESKRFPLVAATLYRNGAAEAIMRDYT